jgi:pimeloyl-ACP methyl ester carboxylesterase
LTLAQGVRVPPEREMRKAAYVFAGLVVVLLLAFAGVIAFDSPSRPPPLASISNPFAAVDFSDLPPQREYAARDGTRLTYRVYPSTSEQVIVLIHGSSGSSRDMHPLAKSLREKGASVYVPDLRGHDGLGRSGDIDYVGQLEDDLADLVAPLRQAQPQAGVTLIGFSSGGGFVLRVIGGAAESLFDRFIMVSPALPPGAPTIRPQNGWVSVALPRAVALGILSRFGIDWFNRARIVGFATPPQVAGLTSFYSFRMAVGFAAPRDYLARLARSRKPAVMLVGGADELFFPDRFAPLVQPARPDMPVTIVPDTGHIGMTVSPAGITAIRKAYLDVSAAG